MIADRPTNILVGEGRYPELVIAQPLKPLTVNVDGMVRQQVEAVVRNGISGYDGRIAAAIVSALRGVLG